MGRLSDDARDRVSDRILVLLALLAPLLMVALGKWRASLDTWYTPLEAGVGARFGPTFESSVIRWLDVTGHHGAELILIADPACPCTRATLGRLREARARSARRDVLLTLRQVGGRAGLADLAWQAVLDGIPATPTLLVVDGRRLLYAGPVTSGNFCTTAVSRVLGLTVLESRASTPVLNWLDRGCYCLLQHRPG